MNVVLDYRGRSTARVVARIATLVVALISASGCASEDEAPSASLANALAVIRFRDVTEAAGIARAAPTYDAVVADFDRDGASDLYVGNHGAGAVLLRNRGDGTFEDVTATSGLATGGDQHGAAAGDFDGDGDLDLYVSVGAGRGTIEKANRLYRN